MDMNTLEYLEKKAQRGRELVTGIEMLHERIAFAKSGEKVWISIGVGTESVYVNGQRRGRGENDVCVEAEAYMINALITVLSAEIKRLQRELDEL